MLQDKLHQRHRARKTLQDARSKLLTQIGPDKASRRGLKETLPLIKQKDLPAKSSLDSPLLLTPFRRPSPSLREQHRATPNRENVKSWKLFDNNDKGYPKRRQAMLNQASQTHNNLVLKKRGMRKLEQGRAKYYLLIRCVRDVLQYLEDQNRVEELETFKRDRAQLPLRDFIQKMIPLHHQMCHDVERCMSNAQRTTKDIRGRWKEGYKAWRRSRRGLDRTPSYRYRPGPLRYSINVDELLEDEQLVEQFTWNDTDLVEDVIIEDNEMLKLD